MSESNPHKVKSSFYMSGFESSLTTKAKILASIKQYVSVWTGWNNNSIVNVVRTKLT